MQALFREFRLIHSAFLSACKSGVGAPECEEESRSARNDAECAAILDLADAVFGPGCLERRIANATIILKMREY